MSERPSAERPALSRRDFLKTVSAIAAAGVGAGILQACAPAATATVAATAAVAATQAPQGTLQLIQSKKYALLSSYNQLAHGWFDPGTGQFRGVDVEIAAYILPKLGVEKWDFIVGDWSGMIPGLQAKRWDLMSIGMSILPKRTEQVLFAEPVYRQGSVIIVASGNPKNIKGNADFAGHKIGAVLGAGELDDIKTIPGAEAVPFKTAGDMFADLKAGRIDACEMDEGEASWAFAVNPDPSLDVLHGWVGKVWYLAAPVFRKEDTSLKAAFDLIIKQMKSDGTMLGLLNKYGFSQDNMVKVDCQLKPEAHDTFSCA